MTDLPRMMPVRQMFPDSGLVDIRSTLEQEFNKVAGRIRPGSRIAVAVGSRGITNLQQIVSVVLDLLKTSGASPFIVPAMGSHGGATAEGQIELLAEYGITTDRLDVPIHASMEAERLGSTNEGVEVFFSAEALRSDGVVVVNRVKPHTDFQSDTLGSGLQKMMVVGLGKRLGAANYHTSASRFGYEHVLRASAGITLKKAPILCGVAIVENHFHNTAGLAVVLPEELECRETQLYAEARRLMPRLPFDEIDLLIVDRLGKNISGAGIDPNVTGRSIHGYSSMLGGRDAKPVVRRIFVRELTPESHGNAVGIGLADFTTTRLVCSMNQPVTALNALTALSLNSAKIPIHFDTDREVVRRALESLALSDAAEARVVRIQDTLSLERVEVSEALARQVAQRSDLESVGEMQELAFDSKGNLVPLR
jgi:hypothetical protein